MQAGEVWQGATGTEGSRKVQERTKLLVWGGQDSGERRGGEGMKEREESNR